MSKEESIQRSKGTSSRYMTFGAPKLGTSVLMGFADFALFTLYALAYQVDPSLVAIALGLGKLTIAASQFFFGWISDAKYTKWGRRKPYLMILSPILGLSFLFLLLPTLIIDFTNKVGLFLWLIIWYQIFNICYGVTTPYGSWMAEQFRVEDRPKTSQYQQFFGMIGTAIMTVFSMVVLADFKETIEAAPDIIPLGFLLGVIIFTIIPIVLFYLIVFIMPTEPHFKIESNMIQNLKTIIKNKNYILVTIMQGIASIAWIMIGSLTLAFITEVLNFDSTTSLIASVIFIFSILIFLYIWRKLIQKIGKKQTLLYIFLGTIVFLPFTLLALIPMDSNVIYGIIFILGLAACMGGWFLFPAIMYADIAEDDEKETGELKAGIYTGFPSIILNLFQAIGLFIMSTIVGLPSVGGLTYSIGYILWGPICAVILLIAYLYSRKFIKLDFDWEKTQ